METLKQEIKRLVENQKQLKNQRRTVRLIGDRTMEPWEACFRHLTNRQQLRILYAVYGLQHGKNYAQIENAYPQEDHPLREFEDKILNLLVKYEKDIVCVN